MAASALTVSCRARRGVFIATYVVSLATAGATARGDEPGATAAPRTAPAADASRQPKLSPEAKAVLERGGAAYGGLKSYQEMADVELLFLLKAAKGEDRLTSHQTTRFVYGGARKFTVRAEHGAVYADGAKFFNVTYGPPDENGKPTEEHEEIKLPPAGEALDWRDLAGPAAQAISPSPAAVVLMQGSGAALGLFLEATEVRPGELDERAGTWVSGKGVCPYTFGDSAGGQDVVPIAAWFSAKSGLLREVRYDISRTSWARSAAKNFGARKGGSGSVNASAIVRLADVTVDEPVSDALFAYAPNAPHSPRTERWAIPMMAANPGPEEAPAADAGTMTTAKPAGTIPAMGMGGPAAMTPAKPAAPAAAAGEVVADAGPGETLPSGETLRAKLIDKPAPDFKTVTPDDKPIALADFKGKVVLMDFWATWCGPCMQAIPAIQRLSEQYQGQDVVVLGINRDKPGEVAKVRKTLERKRLTFPQAMDGDSSIARAYKIAAIPTLIVVDKAGVVRAVHVGYGPGEEKVLAGEIDGLLKGGAAGSH